MIVKDINQYIRFLTGGEPTTQLGSQETDPLLKELLGSGLLFGDYIRDLYDFAVNPDLQVFYEMLQNANDEKASHIFFFFSEQALLIINNGFSFETNGEEKRQLRHFLAKGQGRKSKDSEATGEKGRGSKLLYNLLLNEDIDQDESFQKPEVQLRQALIDNMKGPILYSWNKLEQIESFRCTALENIQFTGNYKSDSLPLLTKLVYSYYPSHLNETLLTDLGEERNIFTTAELSGCIDLVNEAFSQFLMLPFFSKGTLIYLPLGRGKFNKLEQLTKDIIPGVNSSFPFLKNLKTVRIQDEEKYSGKYAPIVLTPPNKESFQLLIPTDHSENLVNFYQTFPITDTKLGLKFIINAKSYTIKGDRQRIDIEDPYNRQELEAISTEIIKYIAKFSHKENLVALLNALIHTDRSRLEQQPSFYQKHFYEDLREAFQKSIPIEHGLVEQAKEKVKLFLFHGSIVIKPADLGINDVYWLAHSVSGGKEEVSEFLGIETWNIADVLANAKEDIRDEWLHNLSLTQYREVLHVINELNLQDDQLKEVPFFRFSDQKSYTWNQIQELETGFLLDKRTKPLKAILQHNEILHGGEDIVAEENLASNIAAWLTTDEVFAGIKALIENIGSNEDIKLGRSHKQLIWKALKGMGLTEQQLREELFLFTDFQETTKSLKHLVHDPRQKYSSGLLQFAKLSPVEYSTDLEPYLLKPGEQWLFIRSNWTQASTEMLSDNHSYSLGLLELETIFGLRENKKEESRFEESIPWIYGARNQVLSVEESFIHPGCVGFSLQEYEAFTNLVERISDLHCPAHSVLKEIINVPFAKTTTGTWGVLSTKWKGNTHQVSKQEITILSKLGSSFFDYFVIYTDEGENYLRLKKTKEFQYLCKDEWVNQRLEQEASFHLLPIELGDYFKADSSLLQPENGLLGKLIDEIGAEHAFIRLVEYQVDKNLIGRYFRELPQLTLSSSDERESLKVDVEGHVVGGLNKAIEDKYLSREAARTKVILDELPLDKYIYSNDVVIKSESDLNERYKFRLSDLLSEYTTEAKALEAIRKKLKGVLGKLFETIKMEPQEVSQKLLKLKVLHNAEQVVFLVAYVQINKQPSLVKIKEAFEDITDEEILESLYQHKINQFEIYSVFSTLQLKECFPKDIKTELKLPAESAPDWLAQWMRDKADHDSRKAFLHENGLPDKESHIVQLRQALLDNAFGTQYVEKSVDEHPVLAKNTFGWFVQQQQPLLLNSHNVSGLAKLCKYYYQKERDIPALLTYHSIAQLVLTEFDKQKIISAQPNEIKAEELQIWLDISQKLERSLLFNELADTFKDLFAPLSISSSYSKEQETQPKHWATNYYNTWRKEVAPEYKIFTSPEPIPLDYSYTFKGEPFPFKTYNRGKHCRQEISNPKKINLFLYTQEGDSILRLLHQFRNELFRSGPDKDKLSTLQDLALRELEQQALVTKDSPSDQVAEEGQLYSSSQEVKPSEDSQVGELIEGIDSNEKEIIQENLDSLKSIMSDLDVEQLKQFAKPTFLSLIKDVLDQENDQATPNQVIGYIGECLIFHYLQAQKKGTDIRWTAIQNPPTAAYDITLLYQSREFLIDVKTTIKPVKDLHDSAAFYIKRSQIEFMQKEQPKDYWIIRISLLDLGLKGIYDELRRLPNNHNKAEIVKENSSLIEANVKEFLQEEDNLTLLKNKMLAFRVSRPNRGEGLPF